MAPKASKRINQVPPPPPPSLTIDSLTEVMESAERKVIWKLLYYYYKFIVSVYLILITQYKIKEDENKQEKAHTATQKKAKVKFNLKKPTRRHFYGDIDESSGHRKRGRYHVGWVLDSRAHTRPRTTSFG